MGIAQSVTRLRERPLPVDEIASTTVQLLPHVEWCKVDNAEREYLLRRGTHILAVLIAVSLFIILFMGVYIAVLKSSQCPDPHANATDEASRAENANSEVLPPCGEDWIWFRNKCYFFSEKEANWTDAEHECATFRASLAVIENQREMDFMRRYIGEIDHWIGLRRESGQPWRWVNGTEFSNWFIIEDYSDCAFLNSIAGSGECYSILNWICTTKERVDERKRKDR